MTDDRRREAWHRGHGAEQMAALWLRLKGYRILAKRFRTPVGEIDLIARRGRILAVVEVKSRRTLAAATEALRLRQRARIGRAVQAYLQLHPNLADLCIRFDVMLLSTGRPPHHITNAWRVDGPD
jgi:putative endonuclease